MAEPAADPERAQAAPHELPAPLRFPDGRSRRLGRMLIERGVLEEATLLEALERQREAGGYLGDLLAEMGLIDEVTLYSSLAEQAGLPFVQLEPRYQDPAVAGIVPFDLIRACRAIPLFRVENTLTVAMDDPTELDHLKELAFATGCRVHGVFTTRGTIDAAIEARTGNLVELAGLRGLRDGRDAELADPDAAPEPGPTPAEPARSRVVVDLIDNLIVEALTARASDIHLEPKARHLRVRFRIDGMLQDRPSIPNGYKAAVLSRCKILASMDIAARRVPQDGAFSMRFKGRRVDFRVSSFPTRHGEVVVIRILDRSGVRTELGALGFPGPLADSMREVVQRPNGILLVTGPTGSGKTTTLYALLEELDADRKKIITLEDPIEYELRDICQGQTDPKAGFTFARGLRSILRQDPDVIMVGEVRDVETARIAIQASLTGHLVMSTLHTNSASSAVARLLDMGLEPFLLATSLAGILAQRLVRRLCGNCREPYRLPSADLEAMGLRFPSGDPEPTLHRAVGCVHCHGIGYRGRMGVFEYIEVGAEVQSMITRRVSGKELERALADGQGFRSLRRDGLLRVEAGETTLEEILRVSAG